jgi:hypothetical protein
VAVDFDDLVAALDAGSVAGGAFDGETTVRILSFTPRTMPTPLKEPSVSIMNSRYMRLSM